MDIERVGVQDQVNWIEDECRTSEVAIGFVKSASAVTPTTPVVTPNTVACVRPMRPEASGRARVRFIFLSLSISMTCRTFVRLNGEIIRAADMTAGGAVRVPG